MTPKFSPTRSAELLALAVSATQGPLIVEFEGRYYEIKDGDGKLIATAGWSTDAAMFASAPDLAAELRIAVEVIEAVSASLREYMRCAEIADSSVLKRAHEALSLIGE